MCHHNKAVRTLLKLEGGFAKVGVAQRLIDLLDAGSVQTVNSEIQMGAGISGNSAGDAGEWCLLQLKDTDDKVAFLLGRRSGFAGSIWLLEGDLLTGAKHKEAEKYEEETRHGREVRDLEI